MDKRWDMIHAEVLTNAVIMPVCIYLLTPHECTHTHDKA